MEEKIVVPGRGDSILILELWSQEPENNPVLGKKLFSENNAEIYFQWTILEFIFREQSCVGKFIFR